MFQPTVTLVTTAEAQSVVPTLPIVTTSAASSTMRPCCRLPHGIAHHAHLHPRISRGHDFQHRRRVKAALSLPRPAIFPKLRAPLSVTGTCRPRHPHNRARSATKKCAKLRQIHYPELVPDLLNSLRLPVEGRTSWTRKPCREPSARTDSNPARCCPRPNTQSAAAARTRLSADRT